MKRRDFSLVCGAALAGSVLTVNSAQAQAFKPQLGADYLLLDKPVAVEAPAGKIEVVEFFGYWCSHCNAFEPVLQEWVKRLPKDISFRRVPVMFAPDHALHQRLYYAIEAMGLVEKLHGKVFAALHAEKLQLNRAEALADWVAKQGVDRAKFVEQFSSFSVTTKASRAKQLQDAYRVEGVPALGVAGRFYTDGSFAKNMPRALQVVEHLVAEIRAGR